MNLVNTPCPRCQCHLVGHFICNCGVCNLDYCQNCGRWTNLPPEKYSKLGPWDALCEHGYKMHNHPEEEKSARTRAFAAKSPEEKMKILELLKE